MEKKSIKKDLSFDVACRKCEKKLVYEPDAFETNMQENEASKRQMTHIGDGVFLCFECYMKISAS